MKIPKVVEGKIANILITIWGFEFFTKLTNQPGYVASNNEVQWCQYEYDYEQSLFYSVNLQQGMVDCKSDIPLQSWSFIMSYCLNFYLR